MREFVCKKCGHTVVVNPRLPADYMPNICTPCYEADEPLRSSKIEKIVRKAMELCRLINPEQSAP